jgi:large subunit ribosomal protein L21
VARGRARGIFCSAARRPEVRQEAGLRRGYTFSLVYAVIKTGGKQERVEEGQTLAVERLAASEGDEVTFDPVLVVDGATVLSRRDQLSSAKVSARVVGETKGPKVRGFTYKPKTRARRSWGHRQRYTTIEITGISAGGRPEE